LGAAAALDGAEVVAVVLAPALPFAPAVPFAPEVPGWVGGQGSGLLICGGAVVTHAPTGTAGVSAATASAVAESAATEPTVSASAVRLALETRMSLISLPS
jgi:hypothetical protein